MQITFKLKLTLETVVHLHSKWRIRHKKTSVSGTREATEPQTDVFSDNNRSKWTPWDNRGPVATDTTMHPRCLRSSDSDHNVQKLSNNRMRNRKWPWGGGLGKHGPSISALPLRRKSYSFFRWIHDHALVFFSSINSLPYIQPICVYVLLFCPPSVDGCLSSKPTTP